MASLTEGISKNVHTLARALTRQDVDARLDCPRLRLEDLNRRLIHVRKGREAERILVRALDDPDVDVLHYHVSIPVMGTFARRARRARPDARKPILGHFWNAHFDPREAHGATPVPDHLLHRAFNGARVAKKGYRGFDAAVVSSRFQERQLLENGFDRPVLVVPNGVDVHAYKPPSGSTRDEARERYGITGDPAILYFGHLSHWKGVDHFVEALPRVLGERGSAQAVIAHTGYGKGAERIRARVRAFGLADRVRFLGTCHVPTLLCAVDVGVVPAVAPVGTACHPNVVLEFLASGVPVVASRVGSIPEAVVEGRTGLLATPADPEDIARKLLQLGEDPALRRRMGEEARRDAEERFDWDAVAREMAKAYATLRTPEKLALLGEAWERRLYQKP